MKPQIVLYVRHNYRNFNSSKKNHDAHNTFENYEKVGLLLQCY